METESPIWRVNQQHKWCLFANCIDANKSIVPTDQSQEGSDKNQKKKSSHEHNPFYSTNQKSAAKGAVVYCPRGYATVQGFAPDKTTMNVKVNDQILNFSTENISSEIPVNIVMVQQNSKSEEQHLFGIQSTTTEIYNKVEASVNDGRPKQIALYYKGKELPRSNENVQKMGLNPYQSLVCVVTAGKKYQVHRFGMFYENWGFGSQSVDAISFTVDKNIVVMGCTVYIPCQYSAGDVSGSVSLVEGKDCEGTPLTTVEMFMPKSLYTDSSNTLKTREVLFKKGIKVKAESDYTMVQRTAGGSVYYGEEGKQEVLGENGVCFKFSRIVNRSSGTNQNRGHIPGIIYLA